MIFRCLLALFVVVCIPTLQSCSSPSDESADTSGLISEIGSIFGFITESQNDFTWHDADGSNVNSSVKLQLVTNTNLDSISWIFAGANPDRVEGVLQATAHYQGYGTFQPYVIIKSIDSISPTVSRKRIDSIYSEPIKVNYSVDDWSSFTSSGADVWDNFGTSNILIGRDTLVSQSADSLTIKKRFEGFNGSSPNLKFSYRIAQNIPSNLSTGNNKKFSVIIDGFERFSARAGKNQQFYDVSIPLKNIDQFDLDIVRYPSLYATDWDITAANSSSINQQTITLYQPIENENTLVGYPTLTASTTVMLSYGNYSFGTGSTVYELVENGNPIALLAGEYKINVRLERGLPVGYSIEKNIDIADDQNRFDLFIYDFRLDF